MLNICWCHVGDYRAEHDAMSEYWTGIETWPVSSSSRVVTKFHILISRNAWFTPKFPWNTWVRLTVFTWPEGLSLSSVFYLTWPDLTWPDLTWPDLTWPDLTWPDLTWPDLT
jgi:hypothetical protein